MHDISTEAVGSARPVPVLTGRAPG